MKKIMIIGSGGAGKSTLSVKISNILNLPLFHLDAIFWKPNWTPSTDQEFTNKPAVPVLPGSPVNSWFPDKLFANFLGYSKGHASVNS